MLDVLFVNMAKKDQLHCRNIYSRRDVLNQLSNEDLVKRCQLDHEGIMFVTNPLKEVLQH